MARGQISLLLLVSATGCFPSFDDLHATADDGVILYINDAKVIDHWPPHQAVEDQGTISLASGTSYDIKVEYHNDNNQGLISLAWSSSSQPKEIVPTSQLSP